MLQRAVVVSFVEVRPQIVALEICKDVSDEEGTQLRRLQSREAAVVIVLTKERRGRRKEIVKDAVDRIVLGFHVGHTTIIIDE